jgi:hypothetical protein
MMRTWEIVLAAWLGVGATLATDVGAEPMPAAPVEPDGDGRREVIIQIFGPFCEYRRDEVEAVLRRQEAVEVVRFLNDHGTVLVWYRSHMATLPQLAAAVEQVLPIGVGCRVRAG